MDRGGTFPASNAFPASDSNVAPFNFQYHGKVAAHRRELATAQSSTTIRNPASRISLPCFLKVDPASRIACGLVVRTAGLFYKIVFIRKVAIVYKIATVIMPGRSR